MATIRDVAAAAGVSVATVSRVLNGETRVQPETEARVRAAIAELHYSPNLLGRNLRQGSTKKILVLLNTISNQFYARVVRGIEECARREGYSVMIGMTHGNAGEEEDYLRLLRTKLVDGAIMLTTERDGPSLERELAGLPVVQACEPRGGFRTPSVSIDNKRAAVEAVRYLAARGHRKIAFFGAAGVYGSSVKREEGYRRALAELGLPIREDWICNEGFSVNAGRRSAARLLERGRDDLPTAVFCISDAAAAGAIRTLTEAGLAVPGDVSVMGFDNTQLSEVFLPSITTTKQPQYDIGFRAMELLLGRIHGGPAASAETVVLPHEIIERDSVAATGETTIGESAEMPLSRKG